MPETEDLQAVERLSEAYRSIADEIAKRIVGQQRRDRAAADRAVRPRPLPAGRRAGPGQDADDSHAGRRAVAQVQPHPVHARPDAGRHHRHRGDPGRQATGTREFRFLPGPMFANIMLADEINRTPPKTQAALLEAMQEQQVTVGGQRHPLPDPFFVLATQNPIEQEGTYPLPEAQLDRFMFNVCVDYPERGGGVGDRQADDGRRRDAAHADALGRATSWRCRDIVRRVPVADHVARYAMQFARLHARRQRRRAADSSATT